MYSIVNEYIKNPAHQDSKRHLKLVHMYKVQLSQCLAFNFNFKFKLVHLFTQPNLKHTHIQYYNQSKTYKGLNKNKRDDKVFQHNK